MKIKMYQIIIPNIIKRANVKYKIYLSNEPTND